MEYLDEDGYPTDAVLDVIMDWPYEKGWTELLELVRSLWAYADDGYFTVEKNMPSEYGTNAEDIYHISTAGWSGNESIMMALQQNRIFWWSCWYQHQQGGHYIFHVRNTQKSTNTTGKKNETLSV